MAETRKQMLHRRAMARRKAALTQKRREQQASAKRDHSIDVGATADVELQYGDQRNQLRDYIDSEPIRVRSINESYDYLGDRLTDIARGRAEGAALLAGQAAQGMKDVAAGNAQAVGRANDLQAAAGYTGAPQGGVDAASLGGQQAESQAYQAAMSGVGVNSLYDTAGVGELLRGQELQGNRVRTGVAGLQLNELLGTMGQAKLKAIADRRSAYAQADADQAAAEVEQQKIAQSERASQRTAQNKLDVATIIALEKFGLGGLISAEKGNPQSVSPAIVRAILGLAGHGGRPSTRAPGAKKKRKAKPRVKRKAAPRPKRKQPSGGVKIEKSGGVKAPG